MVSLALERELIAGSELRLAGVDEVGRGAAAGPVAVGAVLVGSRTAEPPVRLDDSKRLSPAARARLVPEIEGWADEAAVGFASAREVDRFGLTAALHLAAWRAFGRLSRLPDLVLLDGDVDWISRPPAGRGRRLPGGAVAPDGMRLVLRVGADRSCASVAAASVLAKQARDRRMEAVAARHPGYSFERNRGYLTASHQAAIDRLGLCAEHRSSWNISPSPAFRPLDGPESAATG